MKHAEKAGNNNTGKVSAARRRYPSRLSAISGLALLLSCGVCGSASALTFTFDYTYTIVANTCSLTSTGADVNKALVVTGNNDTVQGNFDVDWGTVTKAQLTDSGQYSKKTFGLVMDCNEGDIYQPTLKVTSTNGDITSPQGILYVKDKPDSVAGFAVRASDATGATETSVTKSALVNQGIPQALSETGHNKKILLEAWPVILPEKNARDLASGTDIKGAVTINVIYN
ncbi:hypothetical protein [Salmonella enterica]|uniref:hypothetical protein n=1 Tax=Salmonella enterica TaxID=28901 RepID=UPI0009B170FC|nr:hypothetical protein [Salmonella enterica]ECI0837409.1 hypothetical protein [Salmonella enterica subsp. diarizonae]WGI51854.1 hypothetical protein QBX66_10960 [Salmonella enterica subsp. diarizonae serovar 48:i:z]